MRKQLLLLSFALALPSVADSLDPSHSEVERVRAVLAVSQEKEILIALTDVTRFSALGRAVLHNNLGLMYFEAGRLLDAEYQYRAALAAVSQTDSLNQAVLARISVNLASTLLASGQESRAASLARSVLANRAMAPDGLDVARLLGLLGGVEGRRGNHSEAEAHLRGAMELLENQPSGEASESRAIATANLAALHARTARLAEAEDSAKAAVEAIEVLPQPSPASAVAVLRQAGNVFTACGRFAAAESVFQRAVAISEKAFGASHGLQAGLLFDYAALLRLVKQRRAAAAMEKQAEKILALSNRENLSGHIVEFRSLVACNGRPTCRDNPK